MLDLYAVTSLEPWPDDVPAGAVLLGSLGPADWQAADGEVEAILREAGVTASYAEDWLVPAARVPAVLDVLEQAVAAGRSAAAPVAELLRAAAGRAVLAVAD